MQKNLSSLKIAAQALETEDFLSIFMKFWSFWGLFSYKKFSYKKTYSLHRVKLRKLNTCTNSTIILLLVVEWISKCIQDYFCFQISANVSQNTMKSKEKWWKLIKKFLFEARSSCVKAPVNWNIKNIL